MKHGRASHLTMIDESANNAIIIVENASHLLTRIKVFLTMVLHVPVAFPSCHTPLKISRSPYLDNQL